MGDGDEEPRPTFVILVDDQVVGWVDFDRDERTWLTHDEVNIGYGLHPDARGNGYTTRAVHLLLRHLAETTDVKVATLLIHPENDASLAVPGRCGFEDHGTLGDNGSRFFKRAVPRGIQTYSDGIITLRPPEPGDRDALVGLRDAQFHRFIGEGAKDPRPTFCITIDGNVVGWVDHDAPGAQDWLTDDEVNVGYALHPAHRGNGYATRALQLLVHHLAETGGASTATLAIDHDNRASLAIAARAGFTRVDDLPRSRLFKRPVPPLTYTDGTVTIRPFRIEDAEDDLSGTDVEQIYWLWEPWQAEHWATMTPVEQLEHKRRVLADNIEAFGRGPKWSFAVEAGGAYVGYVDCDLANVHVGHGDANVSYSSHAAHRGKGYVSAAVRLILQFIRDHTGARAAHIVVDPGNQASLRVARSAGVPEVERFVDHRGVTMVRHVLVLR
jgi:RimJ/RimL family protein N-acetyltransferase